MGAQVPRVVYVPVEGPNHARESHAYTFAQQRIDDVSAWFWCGGDCQSGRVERYQAVGGRGCGAVRRRRRGVVGRCVLLRPGGPAACG